MTSEKLQIGADGNIHDAVEAATGPLQDLNLTRQDIPPLLQKVAANPYASPTKATCDTIRDEISQLDALLGADITITGVEYASADGAFSVNSIEIPEREAVVDGAVDNATKYAHDAVIGIIHTHTDILPFRNLIRKISGADRHQKKVELAYESGKLRRAYLKGYAQDHFGMNCITTPTVVEAKANNAPAPAN